MADLRCNEVLHVSEDEANQRRLASESNQHHRPTYFPNRQLSQSAPEIAVDSFADDSIADDSIDVNSSEIASQFCLAYRDQVLLDDSRVFRNMLDLEEFYLPPQDLYEHVQDEIRIHMRKIVADWMSDVCLDQRCHVDVFLLATNIMDRFLATIRLQKKQFQLLGAASIFLASKMVEPQPISALTLIKCTADTYDREELLSMELLILSKLQWDLTAITSYDYLDFLINTVSRSQNFSKTPKSSLETKVRRNTENLVTWCATDEAFMSLPPSLVASAALLIAIERDNVSNEASNPSTSSPNINLNQIANCIKDVTKIEITEIKNCMALIERVFLQSQISVTTNETAEMSFESGPSTNQNCGSNRMSNSRNYRSDTTSDREFNPDTSTSTDQSTPTEVFSVSALYVT